MNALAVSPRQRPWLVGSLALFSLLIALSVLIATYRSVCGCSLGVDLTGTALAYAQQHMVWLEGPSVRSSHTVPLRSLEPTLAQTVSPALRRDVNVAELLHRYGPNRQVALIVLHGVYNSLPPDEGVDVRGDVVVLVDAQKDRVLLLTY